MQLHVKGTLLLTYRRCPLSSVLKDGLAKERKVRGGPCKENNFIRHMEAWADRDGAGRGARYAGEAGRSHVCQPKDLGPAGDESQRQGKTQ